MQTRGTMLRMPRTGMTSLIAVLIALAITTLATPALAYVVQITTTIDLANVADKEQLRQAVESAIEDVLANAITFSPTVVTLENARVVGDRMYLLLLIADAEGEKTLEAFSAETEEP